MYPTPRSRRAAAAWLLISGAALSAPTAAQDEAETRNLDLETFDYVWTTVRDRHWDSELGGLDWDAVRAELRPRAEAATTKAELRAILREMLGRLGQSHFNIVPSEAYDQLQSEQSEAGGEAKSGDSSSAPESKAVAKSGEKRAGEMGFRVAVVDDAVLVAAVDEGSPADRAGVRIGWELVALDGRPLEGLLQAVTAAHPDASTDLYAAHAIAHRLRGTPGETAPVTFRDADGAALELKIDYAERKGRRFRFGHLPEMRIWIESRRVREDVGYIAFNMFMDPVVLMKKFGEAMASFEDCKGIILDLRGNGGGIGFMANGMAGFFVDDRGQSLGTMVNRKTKIAFRINPRLETHDGRIAVLVDGASASTTEIFAGGLQNLKRARIFGTRTAGAALPSVFEKLPNGDRFQFAIADFVLPNGSRVEGAGVTPDVEAKHTRESLEAGRDNAVEAAIAWIRSSDNPNK